ncbi:hemagglutinin repeat-containing protein [Yersinia bercovieri]|uniref:hemagglutinin repeat-containing protein n=1 Tax=Yersinia bercovieri TaxID=634 RepID=UPI0011A32084|nr:hemagglutinin repeat-containing protein [Yersinia bercovieri]
MKGNKFKLSPAGKLAAAIGIISVSIATCYAAGIVGAGDSAHRPDINKQMEIDIINIVPPSASGLSHNQYQEFNVNNSGAVFNNSTTGGLSQLAGQLSANQNLNGQAANIILNEVVGRNPSLLMGKQEVFGMAADYVLANPNGITCSSCGFINTNRSSLVVGNPLVEQGVLQGFDTTNTANNDTSSLLMFGFFNQNRASDRLKLTGSVTTSGILDLIAPVIYSDANITAGEINALSGHNQVSADGKLIQTINKTATNLDSSYLGGMQAGRINLISTSEGSGVKVNGNLSATQAITTSIAGNLDLQAANLQGENIDLKANNIRAIGNIQESKNGNNTTQSLKQTKLAGKNIRIIANKKNHFDAAIVDGKNVVMQGGDIKLDTAKLVQTQNSKIIEGGWNWDKKTLTENIQEEQIGTKITASENVTIRSTTGDIKLSGAEIKAGEYLLVEAKNDLIQEGKVEQNSDRDWGLHEVTLIKDKTWDNKSTKQNLKKSQLEAGNNIGLTAGQNIALKGVKISAKNDILINADEVNIDVQKTINNKTENGKNIANLGLGGNDHNNNDRTAEVNNRSEIVADGKILVIGNNGVSITGSKVKGVDDGYVQAANGGIRIDNAVSVTTTKIDERTGLVFNITGSSHKANNSNEEITGSELVSDANLKVISKDNVDVIGSMIKSAGELGIETLGDINVKAAVEQQKIDEQKTKLTIEGFTSDNGKDQYNAGIKLGHSSESEKTTHIKNQGATLEGGTVNLDAGKDVSFTGSTLTTTTGDAHIKGENVEFLAAQDTTSSEKKSESIGLEAHYTGGMDKAGSGANFNYENSTTQSDKSTAVVSGSNIAGNLVINATNDLTNQGTSHVVDGGYQANATTVNNLAATNSEKTTTSGTKVDVGFEANVNYSEMTRPIEKAINAVQDPNVADAMETYEGLQDINTPNAGVDLSASVGVKDTSLDSTRSVVTTVKAGDIDINTTGAIKDQGTHYNAEKGAINLDAASHTSEAAVNRVEQQIKETFGKADLRISTNTGSDISIAGKGSGGSKEQHVKGEIAQVGSMNAANGVTINVKEDAIYQGTNINAGSGKTTINAGGNIDVNQATNLTSENHNNVDANVSVDFSTNAKSKELAAKLAGGQSKGESSTSIAQASNIQGQQGVELNAGKDLTLTGTSFGSKEKATGDVLLTAGGKVDMQAAQSQSSKQDMTWSAGANAKISKSTGKDKNSKGMGGGLEIKVASTDESALSHQGSVINSNGTLTVKAGSNDKEAIHMQNANITSQHTVLTANNGGIVLESAQDKEHRNNWNVNIAANAGQNASVKKDDKGIVDQESRAKTHDIGAKLNVGVDKLNSVTQQNTQINSNDIVMNSAKDAMLAGAIIAANNINGTIGGDLKIQSRKNELNKTNVNVALNAGHSNEKSDSMIKQLANASPIGSDKIKKKLDEKSTKLFDKAETKYDQLSSKSTTNEEDNVKLVSYTKDGKKVALDESTDEEETKDKWWQKGAKSVGNKVKSNVQEDQVKGGKGGALIDVSVVENSAVETQSAINGKQSVNLDVKGKTQLTGGKISNQDRDVALKTNGLELQDVNGKHTKGGARVNASSSVGDIMKNSYSDIKNGQIPLIDAHGSSEQKNAVAGVTRG